ncbi:hypothetical protein CFK37_18420 [Virgibacillus phasianinus]|uniref:Uncharacterized protein n=1 Tax=Virgibacillus phasianinus TaxID=2017483 RepID=A0A220U769_9BACI|nr:hypothetical protein [Virgibacillus phasianinus]ASK63989.1 hypothetical protein CFK37_18420 [Virgibacillus phasianinus]
MVSLKDLDLLSKGVWFPIIIGIITILFMLFMPKRISWKDIYITFGVVGYVTWMIDSGMNQFDSFNLANPKKVGIGDIISYGIIPSALAVIYINYLKLDSKWGLVILFTVISFIIEWGMVQAGYMKLNGWHTWWSIPVYLIVYGFWLPWHKRLIESAKPKSNRI